jgi:hypothetical protein
MADMIPQGTQEADASAAGGYERGDANIRAVVLTMTVILTSCAVVVALLIPMFSAFTARERRKDINTPAIYAQRQVPPEPRLLPSPVDDEDARLTLGLPSQGSAQARPGAGTGGKSPMGRQNTQTQSRDAVDYTGDNQLPWDKMLNEAAVEQAQYNSYTRNPRTGQVTIPVERAMELMAGPPAQTTAGSQKPGGTTEAGEHGGDVNATTGKQTGAAASGVTRDMPAYYGPVITENARWEAEYEKYTADSSGGLKLDQSEKRQ